VQAVGLHQEILIVDDFSTDGTRDILLEMEEQGDVRVILHGYNRGKGAALRTAFERVKGDVVLVQDADLEYDPADYERLLAPIREGRADVVYGSRFLGDPAQDASRVHRFGNRVLTWLSNLTTGQKLTDMETCYKVFRRRVLHAMELKQERFGFEPEVTAKVSRLGYRIMEVPIRYDRRTYAAGKKIGWRDGVNAIWCILRYAWAK
jgi:glycosyltransferase involved in cell wall biosynthesis